MSDDKDGFRQLDEDRRLDQLDERLARAEAQEAQRTGTDQQQSDPNYNAGNRVLAELIGGMAGGALIGWLADRLLGTWPWGFLLLLSFGIVVAFRNIIRISNDISKGGKS